jgi:hypothetical protein
MFFARESPRGGIIAEDQRVATMGKSERIIAVSGRVGKIKSRGSALPYRRFDGRLFSAAAPNHGLFRGFRTCHRNS